MTKGLSPCPFCGGEDQVVKHSNRWGWFVSCACTAVGPGKKSREMAILAWNARQEPKQTTLSDLYGIWSDDKEVPRVCR